MGGTPLGGFSKREKRGPTGIRGCTFSPGPKDKSLETRRGKGRPDGQYTRLGRRGTGTLQFFCVVVRKGHL